VAIVPAIGNPKLEHNEALSLLEISSKDTLS